MQSPLSSLHINPRVLDDMVEEVLNEGTITHVGGAELVELLGSLRNDFPDSDVKIILDQLSLGHASEQPVPTPKKTTDRLGEGDSIGVLDERHSIGVPQSIIVQAIKALGATTSSWISEKPTETPPLRSNGINGRGIWDCTKRLAGFGFDRLADFTDDALGKLERKIEEWTDETGQDVGDVPLREVTPEEWGLRANMVMVGVVTMIFFSTRMLFDWRPQVEA